MLDELENRGLIARHNAANNRRSHVLHLMQSGESLTKNLQSLHAKLERDLAKALGKAELKTLVELLRAFRSVESKPEIR